MTAAPSRSGTTTGGPSAAAREKVLAETTAYREDRERIVTASERAAQLVRTRRPGGGRQARRRHPRLRRQRPARHHRRLPALLGAQRPAGQRHRRRDRGAAPRGGRRQAGPPRRRTRGPLGAARLRRHHRARPARRGARLLRPRAALEGLPRSWRCPKASTPTGTAPREPPVSDARPTREPGSRRLVLWRHGQTAWNVERRFQGTTDIPLTETGVAQARRAARLLAGLRPAAHRRPPPAAGPPTPPGPRRRHRAPRHATTTTSCERDGGAWEGLTHGEIRERYRPSTPPGSRPAARPARRWPSASARPSNAPSTSCRPTASSSSLATAPRIRLGMSHLLGLPEETWERLGGLSNCCWSVLDRDAQRRLAPDRAQRRHPPGTRPQRRPARHGDLTAESIRDWVPASYTLAGRCGMNVRAAAGLWRSW